VIPVHLTINLSKGKPCNYLNQLKNTQYNEQ
jgi:hypothetical protein